MEPLDSSAAVFWAVTQRCVTTQIKAAEETMERHGNKGNHELTFPWLPWLAILLAGVYDDGDGDGDDGVAQHGGHNRNRAKLVQINFREFSVARPHRFDEMFSKKEREREARKRARLEGGEKGTEQCRHCHEVERVKQKGDETIPKKLCREADGEGTRERRRNTRKIDSEDYRTSQINSCDGILMYRPCTTAVQGRSHNSSGVPQEESSVVCTCV